MLQDVKSDGPERAGSHKMAQGVFVSKFIQFKAVWITCIAWLGLITLNQVMRGYPIVPPSMPASGYWFLHIVIGVLIGLVVYAVAGVFKLMKKP